MIVPTGAGRTALQLRLMRDLGVTVLPAIATYPLRLIEVARDEGFDLGSLRLRVAILGSEMWSDELRARIERELATAAFDIIGMTETGGPGLGIDCAARARHSRVGGPLPRRDRRSRRPARRVADGVEGELVVSTLTRQGLPLVRYRTHDLTRVVSRARCDCGRTSLRLDRLRGRTDDMVIFKGVNFYPRQVEILLLRAPRRRPRVPDRARRRRRRRPDDDGGRDRARLRSGRGRAAAPRAARSAGLSPEIRALSGGHDRAAPGQGRARASIAARAGERPHRRCSRRAASPCSASRATPPSSATACCRTCWRAATPARSTR